MWLTPYHGLRCQTALKEISWAPALSLPSWLWVQCDLMSEAPATIGSTHGRLLNPPSLSCSCLFFPTHSKGKSNWYPNKIPEDHRIVSREMNSFRREGWLEWVLSHSRWLCAFNCTSTHRCVLGKGVRACLHISSHFSITFTGIPDDLPRDTCWSCPAGKQVTSLGSGYSLSLEKKQKEKDN